MKFLYEYVTNCYNNLYWYFKVKKYKNFGSNFNFNVKIDDFRYKLNFKDQSIFPSIVQRIEGRREPQTTAIY